MAASETTKQQDAFVVAYVANGGNATQAAREAGYTQEFARQNGSRLLSKPHIQEAIREEQFRMLTGPLASAALACLGEVLRDSTAPMGARVDAARTVLDRSGFVAAKLAAPVPFAGTAVDVEELRLFISAGAGELMRRQAAQVIEHEGDGKPQH